ncbi:hypothetical protein [Streptomyces sp. NPDC049949]|uniref:barstar family protein n=1 Tax=Streptomyces sp. NPDC049949 TaxID=3154627 RepID=UPI00343E0041
MTPTVHGDEARRGGARYTLTDTEFGHDWGACAEAEGLFGAGRRETYELSGWVPDGADPRGWIGRRVWWVPEDGELGPWLLEDAESPGRRAGKDGLVLTGPDDHHGPPEGYRGPVRLHDERRRLGACREFTRILPPVRTERPLVLRGFAPGEEMRRALMAGTRRSLDLGEAVLKVRDDHVRGGAPLRALEDRPPGHSYELDGRHVTDVPGLYLALGEAVNGPGGYFGGCLDALDDCLGGNFGHTAPATLRVTLA